MNEESEENIDPTQKIELEEVITREREKNTNLKEYLCHLLKENSVYKKKYNELQQQIPDLTNILEKHTHLCQELYDDARTMLQIGTFTRTNNNSPRLLENKTHSPRATLPKSNPQPGPSGVAKKRTRVHIEPLNLQELSSLGGVEVSTLGNSADSTETDLQLTTIAEENTIVSDNEEALAKAKEVYVQLSRLPEEIIKQHLLKNKTVDTSIDMTIMDPHFTSTPLKLEMMKGLGLFPIGGKSTNHFVNVRRTYKKERQSSPTKQEKVENLFAKQKKIVQNELKKLVIDMNEGHNIENIAKTASNRPSRSTKPKQLKEPSLKRSRQHGLASS